MKKLFLGTFFVLASLLGFSQFNSDLTEQVRQFMTDEGWTESTTQYALIAEGKTAYHLKTFYEGNDYAIIGFSADFRCFDVDTYLYDEDGSTILARSNTDNKLEYFEYTPHSTAERKVVIKSMKSYNPDEEYKVKFMIFYK